MNLKQNTDTKLKKKVNTKLKKNAKLTVRNKKQEKTNTKITLLNSIIENWATWVITFISIYLITANVFKGFATYILLTFLVYFSHIINHLFVNVFTSLHQYHHINDNFFSHFIQVVIELALFPVLFYIIYYIFGTIFIDGWIIFFATLVYSTVHNINYGLFHVNNVHSLHHNNVFTNMGPDVCDVIFGTKNKQNSTVENTNHYIPNIIIITILTLYLKYLCLNVSIKNILFKLLHWSVFSMILITIFFSIYIYYF